MFVKKGKNSKKEIDKELKKIKSQYNLKKLELIIDKRNEEGDDKVHIRGEVTPILDGEVINVEIDVKDLPKTEVHYPQKGVSYADPLTANRTRGSSPKDIPGWEHAQLLNTKNNVWRKGHMVSEAFGGSGEEKNISIISQSINSKMDKGPERLAKKETAKGKILIYKTTWENHPKSGKIENFAKNIFVEISEKKSNNILETFRYRNIPSPPTNVSDTVLHLNQLGEGMINKHFGVDLLFAREMILAKGSTNYTKISDVAVKMERYYINQGYSKQNQKFDKMKTELRKLASNMKLSNGKLKF